MSNTANETDIDAEKTDEEVEEVVTFKDLVSTSNRVLIQNWFAFIKIPQIFVLLCFVFTFRVLQTCCAKLVNR